MAVRQTVVPNPPGAAVFFAVRSPGTPHLP